ncbi:MAG: transposase [Desulfobacterales bacterium]
MRKIAYLALDVHVRSCVLGDMDSNGNFRGTQRFETSEQNIIHALKAVKAKEKYLAIEEGTLAHWVARVACGYVTQVNICDPRENALIYKSSNKRDKVDAYCLCRLLRLGELKHVYHPEDDQRAIFKAAVQHYLDISNQQTRLKLKIKAMYRHWGVIDIFGDSVYQSDKSDAYLKQIAHRPVRNQLKRLYCLLDNSQAMLKAAFKDMKQLGRKYPEIKQFKKIPGIGDVGAHVYDAFIQTPHRFAKKNRVWKYCRLAVTDRSSDGKPLGFKRLDKSGIGALKALSYRAFMAAMKSDNEVRRFYYQSLQRTLSRKHARLNTQRKIVAVMYSIWKKKDAYRPELFLDPST